MCMSMYVCVCLCMYVYVYICMCICIYVYMYMYVCIYIYIYIYARMYIHTYIHTYIHIHIYIYISGCMLTKHGKARRLANVSLFSGRPTRGRTEAGGACRANACHNPFPGGPGVAVAAAAGCEICVLATSRGRETVRQALGGLTKKQ